MEHANSQPRRLKRRRSPRRRCNRVIAVFTASLLILANSTVAAGEPVGHDAGAAVQAANSAFVADLSGFFGDTPGDRRLVILGAVSGFMFVVLGRLCLEFLRSSRRAENNKSQEPLP